ncbi:MAG: nuclear transport factor 2 family protein [Flavobacterium sp.]|nr:nuclear transport factor 2 family protein [Flavobacterium sp.]
MGAKAIVQEFYQSDVLLDADKVNALLHPEVVLEWHSTKGFLKLNKNQMVELSNELSKAYIRSKSRISHIVADGNTVAVRYDHYVKTIENPREEMLLAHFMVVWEVKDDKLYRGYQMSQL